MPCLVLHDVQMVRPALVEQQSRCLDIVVALMRMGKGSPPALGVTSAAAPYSCSTGPGPG